MEVDQKTKKRIRNRDAQRTYRSRMKQRLHELQEQVNRMQQTTHRHQRSAEHFEPQTVIDISDDSTARSVSNNAPRGYPTALSVRSRGSGTVKPSKEYDLQHNDTPKTRATLVLRPVVSRQSTSGAVHQRDNSSGHALPRTPEGSLDPMSDDATYSSFPVVPPLGMEMDNASGQNHHHHHNQAGTLREAPASPSTEVNLQRHCAFEPTGHVLGTLADEQDRDSMLFASLYSPALDGHTWNSEMQFVTPPDSSGTAVMASTAPTSRTPGHAASSTALSTPAAETDVSEDDAPSPRAPVEERFEHVLGLAQRLGFGSFDAMALQYYARDFDPSSALALEQRLSRSRRLPGLVAELSARSAAWGAWQRRGYQDEILKAAEEICAVECRESRSREADGGDWDGPGETGLEETLPNLWALLTGLASSNPHLPQKNLSKVVTMTMRLLSGLEDPRSSSTNVNGLAVAGLL